MIEVCAAMGLANLNGFKRVVGANRRNYEAYLAALRAREWSDPLRFALTEAAKHPQSPRATYDVARNFIILSDLEPDAAHLDRAFAALDQAMHVPDATALPVIAAIVLASRNGHPVQRAWWDTLQHRLNTQPLGQQVRGSMATLVSCQIQRRCQLLPQDTIDSLDIALTRTGHPEFLSLYGNFALNVLHDPTLALHFWRQAAARGPKAVQYQVTMARMLIATGQLDEAAAYVAKVRQLDRLGQNEATARELERLTADARSDLTPPISTSPSQ